MNKQLLSLVSLVALAATHPSISLVAAPPEGPGSAAESDRQFLNNLENNEAPKAPPVAPAPAAATPAPAPAPRRAQSKQDQTVIRGDWSDTAPGDAPNPRPSKSVARSAVATPRADAVQSRTTVPARREAASGRTQVGDRSADSGAGVGTRVYQPSSVDGAPTTVKTPTRRTTPVEVAPGEEGTHIIRPPELAQYGVAPTVPTKTTTKVTTTYVLPAAPPPRQADGNEGRDEDRNQEKRFFHRLFHGGLFNKHGEDRD